MRRIVCLNGSFFALPLVVALSGCGPDALTAASGSATSAAAAAKQAKEQKQQIEAQIRQMQQADQDRVRSSIEQVDRDSR